MSSCPVCYEAFDLTSNNLTPRKLDCAHVICTSCIKAEFLNESFYCPECGIEHTGFSIDAFSKITTLFVSTGDVSAEKSENSTSNVTKFQKETTRWGNCNHPDCTFKSAGSHGYCLSHSKSLNLNVAAENEIAKGLATTSLQSLSVKGNSVEASTGWNNISPEEAITRFKQQIQMEFGEAMTLITNAKVILEKEPNILRLHAPVMTVGDLHGQFFDLLNIFTVGGQPDGTNKYLFLGDYVDRGSFSCEVMLSLLAYKVKYPNSIYLIRGNHECKSVSGHFGFKEECKMKYGVQVYYLFLQLFQAMPLAAIVSTDYGDLFACHGGISPHLSVLKDIEDINRFAEPEDCPPMMDLLWSDPMAEENIEDMNDKEFMDFISTDWKPNPARGCSVTYGYAAVRDFLNKNNLVCIVRAHEVQENGYRQHFDPSMITDRLRNSGEESKFRRKIRQPRLRGSLRMIFSSSKDTISEEDEEVDVSPSISPPPLFSPPSKTKTEAADGGAGAEWYHPADEIPNVITVFSAPNYCDRYGNKGSILIIDKRIVGLQYIQYDYVKHPKAIKIESQLQNHIQTVIEICPYMPTCFRDLVRLALELGQEDSLVEFDNPEGSLQSTPEVFKKTDTNSNTTITPPLAAVETPSRGQHMSDSIRISAISGQESVVPLPSPAKGDTFQLSTPKKAVRRTSSFGRMEGVKSIPEFALTRTVSERSSLYATPTSISKYSSVHASDAINEQHPEKLLKFMENIDVEKSRILQSQDRVEELTKGTMRPKRSVADLKKDFEDLKNGMKNLPTSAARMELLTIKNNCIESVKRASILFVGSNQKDQLEKFDTRPKSLSAPLEKIIEVEDIPGTDKLDDDTNHVEPPHSESPKADLETKELFSQRELLALRLMFSLFDRSSSSTIEYDDLIAFAEETGDMSGIRHAEDTLNILDIDGDGKIGLLDFIHFAARLRNLYEQSWKVQEST